MVESTNWKFFLILLKTHLLVNTLLVVELFRWIFNLFTFTKYKKIENKLALVTGGANGIGRAIAIKLSEHGCNIAIADIDYIAAEKTANFIAEKYKVKAKAFKANVADPSEVLKLKQEIENSLGVVDILVNNAGVLSMNLSLREKKSEDVEKIIKVNLMSNFWTVREFISGMIERKYGHIVAIGSYSGKVTMPYSVTYCTSKFGVVGFMSALFDELIVLGHDEYIKTTTVYPSFVNTRPDLAEYISKDIPMLSPERVAEETVNGILRDQRNIFIPKILKYGLIMNSMPDRIIKVLKLKGMPQDLVEKRRLGMMQTV